MRKDDASLTAQTIASMAHDLRSPLNTVIGFARVLLKGIDGPLSDLQAADLERIYAGGNAMLSMVNDLIDLAKGEAGWSAPDSSAFLVAPLLDAVRALVEPSAQAQGVTLDPIDADRRCVAYADRVQIERAVHRALDTIVALARTGRVALRCAADDEGVAICVHGKASRALNPDTARVLRAFETRGAEREQRVDALALGLIVADRIAAANGGRLQVDVLSDAEIALTMHLPATRRPGAAPTNPSQT